MKHRLISLTVTGLTATAAVALAASTALASPHAAKATWSASPGGAIKGSLNTGTTTTLKDVTSGQSISCSTAAANGSVKAGSGQTGKAIASITTATFGSSAKPCQGPLGSTFFSVGTASSADPWQLNAVSYNAALDGGQTSGTLTDSDATGDIGVGATLHGTVLGTACTAVVGGTTTKPAFASGLYDNTSGLLAITGTTNLVVLSSNCPTISKGDTVTFSTTPASKAGTKVSHGYAITPKQKISSP